MEFKDYPDLTTPFSSANINQMQKEIGVIVSPTEPTGNNRRKVWMQKGKNLLDLSNISSETLNGVTITRNEDGSITLNGTATTGFSIKQPVNLSLESGTYTHSITNKVTDIFFSLDNKDGTMIGSVEALETYKTFTLNEKTTYSEYLIWINSGATFSNYTFYPIICQGTDTAYEKYIEPKIYVKNDNDVYEEFISKEDTLERYSTTEQVIGIWVDKNGNEKKLYRKKIYTTTPTVTSNGTDVWKQAYINNVDFGYIVNIISITEDSTRKNAINIFWRDGTSGIKSNFLVNKQNNTGILEIVSNNKSWNDKTVIAIVEYTKTTD